MIKNNQGRKVALEKVRDEMEENHFWQSKQQVQMPWGGKALDILGNEEVSMTKYS